MTKLKKNLNCNNNQNLICDKTQIVTKLNISSKKAQKLKLLSTQTLT